MVVGSGIGGLAIAVLLAKVGKRVLVLEQHDRAGGCCHTFKEQGFEFDVGKIDLVLNFDQQQSQTVFTCLDCMIFQIDQYSSLSIV